MSEYNPHSLLKTYVLNSPDYPGATILPAGDCCVILEFGSVLTHKANQLAASAAAQLNQARQNGTLPGILDIVPAMVTVGVHYLPEAIPCDGGALSACEVLCQQLISVLNTPSPALSHSSREIEIPVCYGGAFGPDLEEAAAICGLSPQTLIEKHSAEWLEVLMLGFAPGHAHIGILDKALNPPRRSTPRTRVRQGSIGLANRQSVIYPMDLPGGWEIIGRTPLALFSATRESPCLLQNADRVKFKPIDEPTFYAIAQEQSS